MKKLIGLICISLTLSVAGFGQNFKGMVFAGLNSAQIDGDSYSGYHKVGLNLGAAIGFPMKKNLLLLMEFAYNQKGSRNEKAFFHLKFHYLEMAFLIAYQTKGKFSFYTGVSPAYLLSSRFTNFNGTSDENGIKTIDFSGHLGFGYRFSPSFELNSRFSYSILNIQKDGFVGRDGFLKAYNNLLTTTVRYYFLREKGSKN